MKGETKVHLSESLPAPSRFGPETLLIFDSALDSAYPPFRTWRRRFPATYGVRAGEELKSLERFPDHANRILRLTREFSPLNTTIVAAGGGSVGDFAGFTASVLKRGARLVHIPTTWLSAIDSSHGGKSGLNAGSSKNQIGTYHFASDTFISRAVLRALPEKRIAEAYGELVKIALLDRRRLFRRMETSRLPRERLLHRLLLKAIQGKLRFVRRDPHERTGVRQALNLGHTLGHVLEAECGIPHGIAVAQGIYFSVAWSEKRGYLSAAAQDRVLTLMEDKLGLSPLLASPEFLAARPDRNQALTRLRYDKKRASGSKLHFIFLAGIGRPLRESVSPEEVVREARRQGWVK